MDVEFHHGSGTVMTEQAHRLDAPRGPRHGVRAMSVIMNRA
jgi:hypothetical protein